MPAPEPILRILKRVGRTPAAVAMSRRIVPAVDGWVHRASGGRWRLTNVLFPTLVLEHAGRRSGRRFRTPLAYVRDGEAYVLAATNFGQAHHPAWSHNLLASPAASAVVDGERIAVMAELATPEERARVWPALLRIWPGFDDYRARSGRDVRVFFLRPRGPVSPRG